MKRILTLFLAAALSFTGCQTAHERGNIKDACLIANHNYVATSMSGYFISCADINQTTLIVTTYEPFSDVPNGIGRLDEYVGIVPLK